MLLRNPPGRARLFTMATAPRRFFRCACFCSENLYVARYGLHVRFRGEQQLRQDYGPVLRSRGCVSPKDFEQLLEEVTLPTLHYPLHTQLRPSVLDLCQQFEGSPSLRPASPRSLRGSLHPPFSLPVPTLRCTWVLTPEKEKEENAKLSTSCPSETRNLGSKRGVTCPGFHSSWD